MVKKDEVKEPLEPGAVAATAAEVDAQGLADFSWAAHAVKLNRAKAWVSQQKPAPTGKAFEAAVKARYLDLKGLLAEEKVARQGKGGKTVNMANDDGSAD